MSAKVGGTPPGQVTFLSSASFVVPDGVTSISVVLVGRGGGDSIGSTSPSALNDDSSLSRGATELLFVQCGGSGFTTAAVGTTIGGNVGGGDGGRGGTQVSNSRGGGGGGAGGYSGSGGSGSAASFRNGQAGTGGAGGGGASGANNSSGGGGGGVGLLGEGASGLGGIGASVGGGGGSGGNNGGNGGPSNAPGGVGGNNGGGQGGNRSRNGGGGGALRYINNLSVTPGETLTISHPSLISGTGRPACRIIWPGDERQFPSTRTANE